MQLNPNEAPQSNEWLKNEDFRKELRSQRDTLIERAPDSLKANIRKDAGETPG
jgi:hypothetical protein